MYMNHWFWVLMVFTVLMGLSICVCVHGPLVLGFGSFHSFDGSVHLCVCVHMNHQFWVLAVFMVLMDLSICVNVNGPMVLGFGGFHGFDGPVHLCACTWTTGFGFWWFSWF